MICPDLVKSRFEKSFASYDAHAAVQADISAELFAQWQRQRPQAGRLLELGCGTGNLTRRLAGLIGLENVYLNDLCRQSAGLTALFPAGCASFLAGDMESVALPQDLDAVVSASAVQWANDLPRLLGRCADSLKRGGWLVLSSFGPQHYAETKALTGIGLTYYSLEQYCDWLAPQFDIVCTQQTLRRLVFAQPSMVLAHMRHTGVSGVQRTPWSRRQLRAFEADYTARFGSGAGVPLTYHPLLLLARKK
ncbi:methyltransferase domain-containing protein [Neisseria shayeganii]|uniref:Biotin biosynthesis protein BioC n=1 Tax=Neisseria shayeganii 871 TaxID=1032488 RepID=G4CKT5_9NEIS|nr:methyltransferase domain-containing protein [Neisseria shayeganii]EGY51618.1 biotin biosynthesis protein BioC [Neisseria shayeganii 871]